MFPCSCESNLIAETPSLDVGGGKVQSHRGLRNRNKANIDSCFSMLANIKRNKLQGLCRIKRKTDYDVRTVMRSI